MKILHIASVKNNPYSGACVAIPAHIKAQQDSNLVALLNICEEEISGVKNQFIYRGRNWQDSVPNDFKRPDIAVFHEVYHIEFVRIASQLWNSGIPYIIIPHGSLVFSALKKKWLKKRIANFLFFESFINNAKAIQCLSENEVKNTGFNTYKFIGTNGVSLPQTIKSDFSKGSLNITYIGRLETYVKGIDLLVKAVNELKKYLIDKNVKISLYGPDILGFHKEVRNLILKHRVDDIICLNGPVNNEEKVNVLRSTDIFIQTSRHEGLPMGLLEAMSYGIPCIVTRGTSLGEIIEQYDAGWVSETDLNSLVYTISRALGELNQIEQKSVKSRRLVEEKFAWNVVIDETVNQYKIFVKS